jgi:hypothetical protein
MKNVYFSLQRRGARVIYWNFLMKISLRLIAGILHFRSKTRKMKKETERKNKEKKAQKEKN